MDVTKLAAMLPEMLPRLWTFALRLSENQHDAEDLIQRACVRGLERAHQLRPDTSPLSWMFSIVHTLWLNDLRARRVRRRSSVDWDDDRIASLTDSRNAGPEMRLMFKQVAGAVDRLPEAQRIVMMLVAVEGLTYQQAAEALEVPIGTIMSRLCRARQAIGACFNGQDQAKTVQQRELAT